jgi:hypothetical protein
VHRDNQTYDEEDGVPKVKEVIDDQVYNPIILEGCYI